MCRTKRRSPPTSTTLVSGSVCAQLCSVLEQQPERVLPCSLTELGVERDVAADDRLKRRTDIADNAAGADDDASDETEIFDGAVAREIEGRRDEPVVDALHFVTVTVTLSPPKSAPSSARPRST